MLRAERDDVARGQQQLIDECARLTTEKDAIASEKKQRKCYMMELDPVFVQTIIKRYYDITNGKKEVICLNRSLDVNKILND